ncbi:hypothetical protein FOZ60_009852 [Perkinsus olseni]|uniref:Secreted protein n=1 Tax=Perkinsus olseni TaxID=32597 RepID=A0A7J6PNC9_PEROL|nr:hypothetical protein FOZ60_009852 [Perkinsus olseni]
MRFFANYFLMTLFVVVDGTCNEAEKEKITGKLFPNFLYKCSLAAKLDTSAIAPCLEGPCQISSECANCFGKNHISKESCHFLKKFLARPGEDWDYAFDSRITYDL